MAIILVAVAVSIVFDILVLLVLLSRMLVTETFVDKSTYNHSFNASFKSYPILKPPAAKAAVTAVLAPTGPVCPACPVCPVCPVCPTPPPCPACPT